MEIEINGERLNVKNVTIYLDDIEFNITPNKFGGIDINKEQYGDKESGIIIKPNVSNVINLT